MSCKLKQEGQLVTIPLILFSDCSSNEKCSLNKENIMVIIKGSMQCLT